MSSRPLLSPQSVITNGDMSTATLTSLVTIIQNISMLSYAVSWSGSTPVGTITVEVSNDYSQNVNGSVRNAGTWTALTFSVSGSTASSLPVSGNTGTGFIDIDQLGAYAVRLKYTKVSGTGTLQSVINGKVA